MTGANYLNVYIVRHGQTDYNNLRILQGQTDTPLNSVGEKQALLAGERFIQENVKIDGVWSSDLQRCRKTTELILTRINHQSQDMQPVYSQDLRERYMGEMENMKVSQAHALAKSQGKTFHDYGETKKSVVTRLNRIWDEIIDQSVQSGHQNILIVSHGGVITKFASHMVNQLGYDLGPNVRDEDLQVPPNTSFTVVKVDQTAKYGIIEMFGDASHVEDVNDYFRDEK